MYVCTNMCIYAYTYIMLYVVQYTMDMSGLPKMYTRSPRAIGPRAEGVHIR